MFLVYFKNMKKAITILIAPSSFKGTFTAIEVALAIKKGVLKTLPNAKTILCPLSDGGDGFLDAMVPKQKIKRCLATNPLGKKIWTSWGTISTTAIIELAKVSGLILVPPKKRNPLITTTYGVGEIIKKALNLGFRKFIIGVGGSATNDAGAGLLQALGVKFLDKSGKELKPGGGSLINLAKIDTSGLDPRIKKSKIVIASDVSNPFTGKKGASLVYAKQKGATGKMAERLENSLKQFNKVVKRQFKIDLNKVYGSGAAGGAAGGLHAILGAKIVPGIEIVFEKINIDKILKNVDLVITGEGCLDEQTLYNKAPIAIAKKAKNIKTIAIAGSLGPGYKKVKNQGIDEIIQTPGEKNLIRICLPKSLKL